MTSIAARLQRVLEQQQEGGAEPIHTLLATMQPSDAVLLRACAIPHEFTPKTLQALDPRLSVERAEKKYARLQRLSVVVHTADGSAIHDVPRRQLFQEWLAPENGDEFRAINRSLYKQVISQGEGVTGEPLDRLLQQAVYYRLAFDRIAALSDLEQMMDEYRRNRRFTASDTLLGMAREYEPVLALVEKLVVDYQEGRLSADRGDTPKAIALFSAISLASDAPQLMTARASYHLGRAYIAERRWPLARRELHKALARLEGVPTARERPAIIRWLGVIEREQGRIDEAERLFQQSAKAAGAIGDRYAVAAAHNALGSAYRESGELRRAVEQFDIAVSFLEDRPFDRARVYHNLGTTLMELRDFTASAVQFRNSLEIKEKGGDTVGQAYTWSNLAHLHHAEGNIAAAVEAAARATGLFEQALDWYQAGSAAMYLASLQAGVSLDQARTTGERALAAFERDGDAEVTATARADLARIVQPKKQFSPWVWLLILAGIGVGVVVVIVVAVAVYTTVEG